MSSLPTHCVVGGGIVGLAVAARLSLHGQVIVLERHPHLLQETSSRNSGVVHAGMYYPPGSMKTQLCVRGNRILRHLMKQTASEPSCVVKGSVCGKWIGAVEEDEFPVLDKLLTRMKALGINSREVPIHEAKEQEPFLHMKKVIESSDTGIIDVHSLAEYYCGIVEGRVSQPFGVCAQSPQNNLVVTGAECTKIQYHSKDRKFVVQTNHGGEVESDYVINCSGLSADKTFSLLECPPANSNSNESPAAPPVKDFQTYYCKGRYLRYHGPKEVVPKRLVYPVPLHNLKGLGVHCTIDLAGSLRFGPDAVYVDSATDLSLGDEEAVLDAMYPAIIKYLPSVKRDQLAVDYAGMRAKLVPDGGGWKDFLIRLEPTVSSAGRCGFVTLAGIESPGLTSSPAIADYVAESLLGYPSVKGMWGGFVQ
jgi:2-hydroxyglutarate dehydrogenase